MKNRVSPSFTLNIQAQTSLNSNMSTFIILQQAGAHARMAKIKIANEKEIIEDAAVFLKGLFNAQVTVYSEEDEARYDPKQRAALAMPGQPAIYIE
jgi:hypothetical protein